MGKKGKQRARRLAAATGESTSGLAERHGFDAGGLLGHETTYAVNVTERVSLAVPAFYSCLRLICDLVSDGEVREMRGTEVLVASRLALRPMATLTRRQWIWLCIANMGIYNGVWLRDRFGRDVSGVPLTVEPIAPPRVSRDPVGLRIDGQLVDESTMTYVPRTMFPTVPSAEHWLVRLARDTIAAAWAAESYRADFWQAGGAPVIYIKVDQPLTNTEAAAISDGYAERRSTAPGKPAVLGKGGEFKTLGADVAAAGAADATEKLGTAIAQFLGVPAWLAMVASPAGSMVYQNASAAGLDLVRYNLRPGYAGPLGDAWSDFLPGGYLTGRRIEIGLEHLTRGTVLEQAQAYAIATGNRAWMLPHEVREELRLPMDMTLDEQGAPAPDLERIPNA